MVDETECGSGLRLVPVSLTPGIQWGKTNKHTNKQKKNPPEQSALTTSTWIDPETKDNGAVSQPKNKAITRHISQRLHWRVMLMNIT